MNSLIESKIFKIFFCLFFVGAVIWWFYSPRFVTEVNEFPYVEIYKCRNTIPFFGGLITIICIKPLRIDNAVSKIIDDSGAFEGRAVSTMLKAMAMYPEAVFLDCGSNIGMYSVVMASAKREVVAVDAMLENLAYVHHSLTLTGNRQYVKLLNNPVSDEHNSYVPIIDAYFNNDQLMNPGGTRLIPEESYTESGEYTVVGPTVTSVTFLDLLEFIGKKTVIVKIDTEGFECKILGKYFDSGNKDFFIPYLTMEWLNIHQNLGSNCPDPMALADTFISNGYTPYKMFDMFDQVEDATDPGSLERLEKEQIPYSIDILWVHKDAKPLF